MAEGFIYGVLEQSVPISQCISDAETVYNDFYDAYTNFKESSPTGTYNGLVSLAGALTSLKDGISECENVAQIIEIISEISAEIADPADLVYVSGTNILFNSVQIAGEIADAVSDWDDSNYYSFGEDIGKIVALIVESKDDVEVQKALLGLK